MGVAIQTLKKTCMNYKKNANRSFENDAGNKQFSQILDELLQLGSSQNDIAASLKISETHLSRMKSGERHAPQKHIRSLNKILNRKADDANATVVKISHRRLAPSIFSVASRILGNLDATSAVEIFRDLLWAQAAREKLPVSQISISLDIYTADGGVDASILGKSTSIKSGGLLDNATRFQVKTGEFKAWQPAAIKKELFKSKDKPEEFCNLGEGVQRILKESGRFVLVCFGMDFTDEQIRKSTNNIEDTFKKLGFPGVRVEVWGQSQLLGFLHQFPALCLKLMGHDQSGFRSRESWVSDADMHPSVHYSSEQFQLLEELRTGLTNGEIHHLRLWGEPGVGKTRFALELTASEILSPVTLFVKDSQEFLGSSFLNELTQSDDHRFAVLVIDECSSKDCAEIWNILKAKGSKVRLITIDHANNKSIDDKFRQENIAPTDSEEIIKILLDYGINQYDARRWAGFCEGSPRVAHVLGGNLRRGDGDLLAPPSHVDVWDKFITGNDDSNSEIVQLRKKALLYISLFEKFGFLKPVEEEAKCIAQLADIPWAKFQDIVADLTERRILQGKTTLYITPRLLQIFLFHKFWEDKGQSFELAGEWINMPQSLKIWFINMLKYAHTSETAGKAIRKLLRPNGIFPGNNFPDTDETGRLLHAFAEASPKETLRYLKRTIGTMNNESLMHLVKSRQWIVWALEMIAVWEDYFVDASKLLLKLAKAENANCTNNATGTFKYLFSLIPGMSATQASPEKRIDVLKEAFNSPDPEIRFIAVKACECALDDSPGFRTIGPEHQGVRETVKFWSPKTYGELWDAYREVWGLLIEHLNIWSSNDREELIKTIIKSSYSVIDIEVLSAEVVETLKRLATDPQCDISALISFLRIQRKHKNSKLSQSLKDDLDSIQVILDGDNFSTVLKRYVKYVVTDDYFDDEHNRHDEVDQKVDKLVEQATEDPALLHPELSWLIQCDSNESFWFAYKLASAEPSLISLPEILGQITQKDSSIVFLSGYLAALFQSDIHDWEAVMLGLQTNPNIVSQFSDVAIHCGLTDNIASVVIDLCNEGKQSKKRLEKWCYSDRLHNLSPEVVRELVLLQISDPSDSHWNNAIRFLYGYYMEDKSVKSFKKLPEELTFEILTHPQMSDRNQVHDASYYWGCLTTEFLAQYPHRHVEFIRSVFISASGEWSVLSDLDQGNDAILTCFVQEHPIEAFDCIKEVLCSMSEIKSYGLKHWLSDGCNSGFEKNPGPIIHIPQEELFQWVDLDVEKNGYWLAGTMPKTLDDTIAGRLTRNFLAKYGNEDSISSHLHAHFHNRGWCGNASDFYRGLR